MFTQTALLAETGRLQKFAFTLTKNKPDADDLFQSTCLRALENTERFQTGTNLFSWTSKIMYNLFVSDYRRRTKFETQYDPESYLEKISVEAPQDINVELANVKKAMMKLSAAHREILVSICVKGMRYEEVSTLLQIPVGTVRSRLSRAREQLQAIIDTPPSSVRALAMMPKNPANINMPVIPAYIAARALQRKALQGA